jgi:hypothetical protein
MKIINPCSIHPVGDYCKLSKIKQVSELIQGMDFRKPEYRKEVFLRFYEFHLKYKSHAGAVYFMLPFLKEKFNLTDEEMLWITFINGVSQNIITTWILFEKFPDFKTNPDEIQKFIMDNWNGLGWDMDRRYVKAKFNQALSSYQALIGNKTQTEYWNDLLKSDDKYENFKLAWNEVMKKFNHFGRLSTFSYLEYQKIIGLNLDCNSLFLDDMNGSKSHRNGIVKVLGRDDMDWHKDNTCFNGYSQEHITWIENEATDLLKEAEIRFKGKEYENDVSFFTLETTLCCYKSWHRVNRRYPNVYMDMFYERIKKAENHWKDKKDFSIFWEARKKYLPKELRLEDNNWDIGLNPLKQNHYLATGQVIMMDLDWDCFKNNYKKTLLKLKK